MWDPHLVLHLSGTLLVTARAVSNPATRAAIPAAGFRELLESTGGSTALPVGTMGGAAGTRRT